MRIDATRFIGLAAFALLLLCEPASARVVLEQCNNQIDGAFQPVLIVRNGASRTTVPAGTDGLTRNIILSEQRAKAWARQRFNLGNAPISYIQCGMGPVNNRRDR